MCVFHSSQFTFMTRNQAAQPPNAALERLAHVTRNRGLSWRVRSKRLFGAIERGSSKRHRQRLLIFTRSRREGRFEFQFLRLREIYLDRCYSAEDFNPYI